MHLIAPNLRKSSIKVKILLLLRFFTGCFLLLCFTHPCRQKPRSWRMPRPISVCHPQKSSWRRRDTQQQARACRTWGAAPSAKTLSRFPLWSVQQNLPRMVSSQGWDLCAGFAFSIPTPCLFAELGCVTGGVNLPAFCSGLLQSGGCLWNDRIVPS